MSKRPWKRKKNIKLGFFRNEKDRFGMLGPTAGRQTENPPPYIDLGE